MENRVKGRERVLIVDDNLSLAENIAEILQAEGCTTDVAGSAEEALPKALTQEFGVVVTDLRLPGMDGIELLRTLGRQRMNVVTIVISAYIDDGTALAAKEVGACFLEKPLNLAALSRFVLGGRASA